MSKISLKTMLTSLTVLAQACLYAGCKRGGGGGDEGSSGPSSSLVPGIFADITGTAKNFTGSQAEMYQWVVVFLERDSGIVRLGSLDRSGNYSVANLATNRAQTVALLDSSYRLAAVLSHPGPTSASIYNFLKLEEGVKTLPTLVQQGPIVSFANLDSFVVQDDISADSDEDGIPDGMDDTAAAFQLVAKSDGSKADTDADGTPNNVDPDIDGDGIVNWLDADDDGDGLLDMFSPDANGNGVRDVTETIGDLYFPEIAESFVVQVMQDVQADNSLVTYLVFSLRANHLVKPDSIAINGPSTLLKDASVVNVDANGDEVTSAWDSLLLDNGENEDGSAKDGVYGRKILLSGTTAPKDNQMVFADVNVKIDNKAVHHYFPFTFPAVTTGAIAGAYTSESREVRLDGAPFGESADFSWTVNIYDADGVKIYTSSPIAGTSTTFTIPGGVLSSSGTYTARIVANALDRIPSYPVWIVRSASFNLE